MICFDFCKETQFWITAFLCVLGYWKLNNCIAVIKEKGFGNYFPKPNLVGVTRLERAIPASQTNLHRFFPWFTRLFGAFVSKNDAFGCSYKHCFHVVRSRRWSKLWSIPFRWDVDAIRKSKIRLRINSFSAVIIPYISAIVKCLPSTRKNCSAVVKENPGEKS